MFKWKPFKSHAGKPLSWKIECDDMPDEDIECIARLIYSKYSYKDVGCPDTTSYVLDYLIHILKEHTTPEAECEYLLIDDVLTTGKSMEDTRNSLWKIGIRNIVGIVIFARNKYPPWITPVFELNKKFDF